MNALFLTPTTAVVNALLPTLMALIPDDIMQTALDTLFDNLEEAIAKSDTRVDDALILPLIAALRQKLNVPDRD